MTLSYYGKRAVKWTLICLLLYGLTIVVREVAWAHMMAGDAYMLGFIVLVVLSSLGTVALGMAILYAMMAV